MSSGCNATGASIHDLTAWPWVKKSVLVPKGIDRYRGGTGTCMSENIQGESQLPRTPRSGMPDDRMTVYISIRSCCPKSPKNNTASTASLCALANTRFNIPQSPWMSEKRATLSMRPS